MLSLRLALRNLARNRRRTWLTLGAVAIGVTAVVSVRGFFDGLQGMLIDGVIRGGGGALQIHRQGFLQSLEASPLQLAMPDANDVLARVEAVDGVAAASARLTFPAMISAGDDENATTTFAFVTAYDPVREARVSPIRKDAIVDGKLIDEPGTATTALELLDSLHAHTGMRLTLLANDVDGVLNGADVKAVGTIAAQAQGNKRTVLMRLDQAQELVRLPGQATEIIVAVRSLDELDAVAARLRTTLGPTFDVRTWEDQAPFIRDARAAQNAVLSVLTGVFLVVILLGIANTLLMSVLERVREIGTLMAVGFRRRRILALFVIEGILLGVAGALVGDLIGAVIIKSISLHGITVRPPGASLAQTIFPVLRPAFMARMIALAAAGAGLAALGPAWRASRLRPVEALSSP